MPENTVGNCWFPSGHFWSIPSADGVCECLWCYKRAEIPTIQSEDEVTPNVGIKRFDASGGKSA